MWKNDPVLFTSLQLGLGTPGREIKLVKFQLRWTKVDPNEARVSPA